jgi:hypothetical protein
LTKLGEADLAGVSASRGLAAAGISGSNVMIGSLYRPAAPVRVPGRRAGAPDGRAGHRPVPVVEYVGMPSHALADDLRADVRTLWDYHDLGQEPVVSTPTYLRRRDRALYSSLFRFDDTLIVNPHTLGAAASQSPLIHLRRIDGGRLFSHQMAGFERAWQDAEPVDMPPAGPGLLR